MFDTKTESSNIYTHISELVWELPQLLKTPDIRMNFVWKADDRQPEQIKTLLKPRVCRPM
jgi:hypothetical protein